MTCNGSPALQNTMVGDLVWLFCVLLVLTLVGRAAFVFPLSLLHNWYASERLSFKEMVVIWCAPQLTCASSGVEKFGGVRCDFFEELRSCNAG